MLNLRKMKNISGYIFRLGFLLVTLLPATGQDTLRTYGPRIGMDLARFVYIFADPSEIGAEFSVDLEVYENVFPVFELGYNTISEEGDLYDYKAGGPYTRVGADYNFFPVTDRSVHHSITIGFRYGISTFSHRIDNLLVPSNYWGDLVVSTYENTLAGQWFELVGGMKTELVPNLFLGWMVRYKILLNPDMDPLVTPQLIPGYGRGTSDRGFGFSYSIFYKIPILKR